MPPGDFERTEGGGLRKDSRGPVPIGAACLPVFLPSFLPVGGLNMKPPSLRVIVELGVAWEN